MASGITRKDLKRDELVEATVDATHWLEDHWQKVVGVVAVVLVVGLAVGFWSWNTKRNHEKASAELSGAVASLVQAERDGFPDRGVLEGLLARFEAAAERGGTEPSGETARYYAASVLMRLERYDDARNRLDAIGPEAPTSIRAAAAALRPRIDEAAGDPRAALDRWLTLADQPDAQYPPDQALLEAARLQRQLGEDDAARATWQRIVDQYPAGGAAGEARRQLGT